METQDTCLRRCGADLSACASVSWCLADPCLGIWRPSRRSMLTSWCWTLKAPSWKFCSPWTFPRCWWNPLWLSYMIWLHSRKHKAGKFETWWTILATKSARKQSCTWAHFSFFRTVDMQASAEQVWEGLGSRAAFKSRNGRDGKPGTSRSHKPQWFMIECWSAKKDHLNGRPCPTVQVGLHVRAS